MKLDKMYKIIPSDIGHINEMIEESKKKREIR